MIHHYKSVLKNVMSLKQLYYSELLTHCPNTPIYNGFTMIKERWRHKRRKQCELPIIDCYTIFSSLDVPPQIQAEIYSCNQHLDISSNTIDVQLSKQLFNAQYEDQIHCTIIIGFYSNKCIYMYSHRPPLPTYFHAFAK